MAYDKVVDSAALEANLTAIADAIREKGGTTDTIAFSAMADAIAAIKGDVAVETGTFVPASDTTISISHNLGESPNVFFWFVTDFTSHDTTTSSGGVYPTSTSTADSICGGYMDGQSFYVKTAGSRSISWRYYLYSDNTDAYGRLVYGVTSTTITSPCGALAQYMTGETVRWLAAVV